MLSPPLEIPWVSNASGNAEYPNIQVVGIITAVEFWNNVSGSQPTNGYGATLKTASGYDLLKGGGVAISNSLTTPTRIVPVETATDASTKSGVVAYDTCTLLLTGVGVAKQGTVRIYLNR